jgi:hypothetical protein
VSFSYKEKKSSREKERDAKINKSKAAVGDKRKFSAGKSPYSKKDGH